MCSHVSKTIEIVCDYLTLSIANTLNNIAENNYSDGLEEHTSEYSWLSMASLYDFGRGSGAHVC